MQVFCIVNAQGGVQAKQSRLFKKAVHSAEGCSTATTIANTVIKQKLSVGYLNQKKGIETLWYIRFAQVTFLHMLKILFLHSNTFAL